MSSPQNDEPVFVLKGTLRTLFVLNSIAFTIVFLVIVSFLGTNYGATSLLAVGFLVYMIIRIGMYRTGSKGRHLFYEDRFKSLDGEKLVKQRYYSDLKFGQQLIPPFGKRPALVERLNGEIVLPIPRTGKKEELDELRLADWLKTKVT